MNDDSPVKAPRRHIYYVLCNVLPGNVCLPGFVLFLCDMACIVLRLLGPCTVQRLIVCEIWFHAPWRGLVADFFYATGIVKLWLHPNPSPGDESTGVKEKETFNIVSDLNLRSILLLLLIKGVIYCFRIPFLRFFPDRLGYTVSQASILRTDNQSSA
ncbi:hypothetical protein NC652_000796 [Populus alba x Populus x berolinensis]|nr:hypothetical protein NC652_000796 [Populus alba x Populus x berolinensis]